MDERKVGIRVTCSLSSDALDELTDKAIELVMALTKAKRLAGELEEGIELPIKIEVFGKEEVRCTE